MGRTKRQNQREVKFPLLYTKVTKSGQDREDPNVHLTSSQWKVTQLYWEKQGRQEAESGVGLGVF